MDSGSATVAARHLSLSQPAVSQHLAQLEAELRLPLFVRERGRLVATGRADALYAEVALAGAVAYASKFLDSPGHLGALTLASAARVSMSHAPFKQTTQLFNAVANGEVAWAFGSAATAGHLQTAGRVRYLAIGMPARLPAYPDVPTVLESGGPAGYTLDAWVAVMAPRNTPAEVARRLHGHMAAVMSEPELRQRLVVFGYEAYPVTAEKLSALMAAETARYDGIIKAAKLNFD